uniref:Dirigent protein n=1 Tax=Tetradesmus obliquus TaxID=3088 RepID=A0A383V9E6_TETOB|eukprot:jgi/Sobl393_1/9224/SZX60956.1
MTRAAFVVTALMTFVLLAQADEAQPGHWGGKPGGSSGPRFSTLSGVNYMPAATDNLYRYYRFSILLTTTFAEAYDPTNTSQALLSVVSSGDVTDAPTGTKVGVFQQNAIVVTPGAPGATQAVSTFMTLELGTDQDDSIQIAGSFDQAAGSAPADHDLAITGGTGVYTGAGGFIELLETKKGTLTVYVPRYRKF